MGLNVISEPELSGWVCYLFGNKPGKDGLVWKPYKGNSPCWFWREMQWLCFGNLWKRE